MTRGVPCSKLIWRESRGAPCSFKCKQGLQERKRQGRQIDGEKDERGAMQFQVQAGAPGKKTSGASNWRRKGQEGCHAISSASRGSREENVRGAKLTEKRTRGVPCSFKCKQGLQGRKRQGRQIDGEKDQRGAMQLQAGAPGKKTSGAPNWRRKGQEGAMQFQVQAGALGKKTSGAPNWRRKGREGAMQFQVQAGAPGKKTSGVPNWRRKGREGRHAVSSASRGSREENVRGPKSRRKGREGCHAVN